MFNFIKRMLLIAALMVPWVTQAQSYTLESYGFATGVDASKWVDMTSATQILTPSGNPGNDGLASGVQTIGFAFPFAGQTYTQYSVNTDGNLRLGATVTGTSNYTTPFNSTNASINNPKINVFGCDGYGVSGTHYVKALAQELTGGDSLLVVEFCTGTFNSTTRNELYKWQIHLYSDGNIDIVFPAASALPAAAPNVAHQCGLCASASDGWVIDAATNTAMHFNAGSTATNALGTWFDANRYYTFIHPSNISCPAPTGVTVTNVTADGATISWTAGGTESAWELTVDEDTYYPTTTSYTLTGLDANTPYVASVRAICGSGDTSFASSGAFRTECDAISQLPYSNGFENDPYYSAVTYAEAFPYCWHRINDATNSYTYYPYVSNTATYVHSGTNGMYWYHSSSSGYAQNMYAVLPAVDLNVYEISDLVLSFWAKTTSASYHPMPIVGVMTDPNDATTFTAVHTFTNTDITTSWQMFTVSFASYTGTGSYIAIKWPNPGSTSYMAIDDIFLTDEWCDIPLNVAASSAVDEVTVSWNSNGGSSFTVFLGTDTVNAVTDTFYTFSNLTANTQYAYGVSTECTSSNSEFICGSIRTLCNNLDSLPYTQTFESAATGGTTSAVFVDCLTRLNNGTQYFGWPYVSATASYNHTPNGTKGLYWLNSATAGTYGDYQYVVMPGIDTDQYEMNTLQFKFWARATGTSYHPVFQVGVMTDPHDYTTFQLVESVNVEGTTYTEYTVTLGAFEGNGNYIALRALRPGSSWYATVDDLTIEIMPNCPPIVDIDVTATAGSAMITWGYQNGYDEPAEYEVVYDSINGSSPTTLNPTDQFVLLSGLEAGTQYKVFIRANCGNDYGAFDSITFSTTALSCLELDSTTIDSVRFTNSTSGISGCIAYSSYGNTIYQTIYTASELTAAGLTAGTITGIDLGFTANTANAKEFTIFLGHTNISSISNATMEDPNNQVQVYGPAAHPLNTSGWKHYDFTTPFTWDGVSNIIMTTFMNQPSGVSQTSSTGLTGYYVSASNKARYRYRDSSPFTLTDYNSGNAGSNYSYRASIHFWSGECQTMAICSAPATTVTDVTATTADITWLPGYNETSWDLSYRELGTSTWTTVATGETSTEYQFTNLTPGTDYELRVSFECGDANSTEYSSIVTARTVCSNVSLPYSYGFEDVPTGSTSARPDIPCWHHLNNATSYPGYPYIYASAAHSGSRGLYWGLITTTGTYGDYEVVVLPPVDTNVNPIRTLQLSFWAKPTSVSYAPVFLVGAMTDPADISTFEFIDSIIVDHVTTDWALYEVFLNSYEGEGRYVAIRANRPTSAWYAYTDDFTLDVIPSCPHVTHLTVDSTSQNSVSLSWTAGSSETSWSVSDGTNYYTTADPYITITGLATNTAYTFEVRALCSSDDSSNVWTVEARTECEPYMALPYSENFDSYTTSTTAATNVEVPCWGRLMTGTSTYQTGSYLPMVYYSTSYAHSGNYSMRLYGVGYHSLPQLPCPADSVTISFWATSTSSSYKCFLGIMSDPNNQNTFDTIQEIIFPTYSTPQHFEINLQNYTGTGRYIAFRNAYTTASTYYSYIYLDDIDVWHNTNCGSPVVNLGNVTNNTIDVTWLDTTVNGYANGVTVMWNTANTTSGAQTASVAAGSSYTINGLNGNTTYYIWIAGNCGNELSRPVSLVATTASDCGIVENLTLAGVSDNTLGISWNAPSIGDPATSYIVTLKKCTNIPFANDFVVVRDTVNATYYMFNGLEDATTYAYSVTTVCNDEVGEANSGYATTTICEMDTVGDYATNYSAQPIYASQAYSYTQQLYMSNELAGIDSINSIAIYQRGLWGEYEDRNVTVYLGHTNKTEFGSSADYVPMSNLTQVYSGRLSGFGWISLKFDTTYVRVADSNLVVVIDDNTGVAHTGNCYWACSKFDNPAIYRAMRMYSSSNIQPTSPSGTYARDYYRAFIVFGNAGCENDGCDVPVVMQSAAYADHVDITWNAAQGASYDVSYRILGADNWTTVATGNTSGSATINGLGASFLGEARVSYTCNNQTVSGTTQIQTLCGQASLPLTEDFQSWDYGHFNRPCWISNLTDPTNADREYPYITALTGDENNMLCFMRYGAYLILPEIDTNLNVCQIRFKLTQGNDDAQILIGVIDDASMPIQTMYVLDTMRRIDYDTTSSTANIIYSFANIPAAYNHGRIAFWDAMSSYSFIDDIVVEMIPACTPVSELTASASTNAATISWSVNGDNATSYYIIYGPRGFTAGQGDTITATGSPVTITGLNHSTNYDAYVYTVCDLLNATSSASNVVQFTTDCAPYTTLPYTENFENLLPAGSSIATVLPNCWASETGSSAVAHVVYTTNSAQATSPQHAFYMYENGVVALPEMGVPLNTLQLSFHECNTNSQGNGLVVGTVDNVNTGFAQTFVPYDTIFFANNQNIMNVVTYFSDYTGTANRIALRNYTIGTGNYSEHYIDDLVVDLAPACISPQRVRATYLVDNAATVEWLRSNSSSYTVEYGAHGFVFGTGTQSVVTARSIALTGLTAQTQYDVYIWGTCGDTVFYTFTTPCAAVSLPFDENFDSYTTSTTAATGVHINCWDYIMTGNSTYQGATYQPQIYYSSSNAHSGSYSYRLYGESYAMLPPMPTTLDSLQLTFWDYTTSTSYGLEVGVMEGNLFIPIQTINSPTSTNVEYEIDFGSYHGNSRIIAFRNKYTTSSSTYYSYHYLDDIYVDYLPTCPKVSTLQATAATTSSITIDWTDLGGSPSEWEIEYTGNGATNVINVNAHPTTISTLLSSTPYSIRVRPICGASDTGMWCNPIRVATECSLVSLPYNEDFESYSGTTYSTAGDLPVCWDGFSNGTSAVYFPHITGSGSYSYPHSGTNALTMTSGGGSYGDTKIVVLPPFDQPMNTLSMTFWYKMENATNGSTLYVGYVTGPDYNTSFVPIKTVASTTTLTRDSVSFDTVPATATRIAFKWYYNTSYYSCGIDDIEVTSSAPSCSSPTLLPVSDLSYNTATLNWSSTATNFEVAVKTATDATWPAETAVSGATSLVVNNLQPAIAYQYRVRAICDATENLISTWAEGTFVTDSLPCFAPSDLQTTELDVTSATFTWTAGGEETQWSIHVWNSGFNEEYTATAIPFTVTGLTQTTTYNAAVKSLCGNGDAESEYSDTIQFTTATCGEVTGVIVSNVTTSTATVSWNAGTASSYEVEYGEFGYGAGQGHTEIVQGTTYNITGLESETQYSVRVRAVCEATAMGPWTDPVNFTTGTEGINVADGMNVSIYPNPTSSNTTIALSGVNGDVTITIVDMNGRVVMSDSMSCEGDCVKTMEVSGLAQGAYFVRVNGENVNMVKKLVVK